MSFRQEGPGAIPDALCAEAQDFFAKLVPGARAFPTPRIAFARDESYWLLQGVRADLFQFQFCGSRCDRLRRWKATGPDEFLTPNGASRHLFSSPHSQQPTLNREYLPHMAAHSRAILSLGYDRLKAEFSHYRTFQRDLILKRHGGTFEIDSLFYSPTGRRYLHLEAKADPHEVTRLARGIDQFGELTAMPRKVAKEIEYVLDIEPAYFWLAGPGTVDPEAHVWRVTVDVRNARFERVGTLPPPA